MHGPQGSQGINKLYTLILGQPPRSIKPFHHLSITA